MATRPKAVIESRNGEKFSPITITKNVLTDDGQNLHDILSDRKEDMMTPTIENSSSMFKVGQGDTVDYSSNVVNGAYESMVLKGKTMVNYIQEPSSQDIVLPYEFEDGQYVTINDTKESGALGVELKGQTLVNLVEENNKEFQLNATGMRSANFIYPLIDGKKYFVNWDVKNYTLPNYEYRLLRTSDGKRSGTRVNTHPLVLTGDSNGYDAIEFVGSASAIQSGQNVTIANLMVLEYVEGMENWDIPYFEGMASCKMPILRTVGKNLLNNVVVTDGWVNITNIFKKNTTYILSADINNQSNVDARTRLNIHNYDGTISYYGEVAPSGYSGRLSTKICHTKDFYKAELVTRQYFHSSPEGVCDIANYQLELATSPTPYEQHKSSILSLPEEVVLRSLPNGVCDTFNTRTGVYTQRIGEVVLNGSESWSTMNADVDNRVIYTLPKTFQTFATTRFNSEALCDKFKISSKNGTTYLAEEDCFAVNGHDTFHIQFNVSSTTYPTANEWKAFLRLTPVTLIGCLQEPIITKINLSSTLKSWNTTTHIYSKIPENTLYPILSHSSNPTYSAILKPSTKYSIVANSYSNNHTNSTINFNLGGATASTTVGNRVTTITTPSTLSNELLTMSGHGNKLNNVMVIEGDVVGDEPYFEGICDVKSPILSNVGKNLFDSLDSTMKSSWWIIVENGVANVKKEDLSTNYSVIIPAQSNTKYKVSGNNFTRSFYAFLDKDYNVLHADEMVQRTTKSLSPQGTAYALFYLNHEDIEKVTNLQIEEGSTETPYEPYKSNTTTFKQKDGKMIVLRSLPNGACDTLNVETGEYIQRIGEVVLDGSENWAFYGATGEGVTTAFKLSLTGHISAWMSGNGHCDRLKFVSGDYIYRTNNEGITTDAYNFVIRVLNEKASTIEEFKSYLKTKSLTVQYELATPIVKTVDLSGFPYAYTNGHVQLSSGHSGQSLTPKVEYSVTTNRNGQIRSNQKMVERHQKQLDRLQAMVLTNLVNTQYEQTLTNLKYDLKNVREEVK